MIGTRYDARVEAQRWARRLLERPWQWVLLDTETTGLDDLAEVVQIGVLAPDGTPLLDTLVRPTRPIPPEATAIHGISNMHVAQAPRYRDVHPRLEALLRGKTVVVYNAQYDARVLRQTARLSGLGACDLPVVWQCAMEQYARYVGRWSDRHGSFLWQPLPRSDPHARHQALDDCRLTLALIRRMAAGAL